METFCDSIPLPVLAALVIVAGVACAVLFRKGVDKLISLRKNWAAMGKLLGQYGHTIAANLLQDLAIGDLPDALADGAKTLKTLQDPTTGPALLQADLISQINAQIAMPGNAPAILQTVAAFVANPVNAAAAKAAGLAVVAVAA
jgi:hypothetical protein